MSLDDRRRADRNRKFEQAIRDNVDRLPQTRDIDAAIALAVKKLLAQRFKSSVHTAIEQPQPPARMSEIGNIVSIAFEVLNGRGYDVRSKVCRARVFHRVGDLSYDAWLVRPREI